MSSITFFRILGACVPQALQHEFQQNLYIYAINQSGPARAIAYRGMIRILARGFSQLAINAVLAIARPILAAAGAVVAAVAKVMSALAAGAAAALESPVIVGMLVLALLAIIVWVFVSLMSQAGERRQLEQRMELDRSTRSLFSQNPIRAEVLLNNPNSGPVYAINAGQYALAV
ncbi:MAG: hypothetical protein IT167_22365 [Bryobacterales bacterium]|nr:hypothetical protein [Bryobacterales bacterium]